MQLRRERELRGWSRNYVAEQVEVDVGTVGRWERGERMPHAHYRQKLCALFGMNALDLGFISNEPDKSAEASIDLDATHVTETPREVAVIVDTTLTKPTPEQIFMTTRMPQVKRRTFFWQAGHLGLGLLVGSTCSTFLFSQPLRDAQAQRLSTFIDPNTSNWINNLAWSANGRMLAAASEMVLTWDTQEKALVRYYPILSSWVNDVSWSKDNLIAAANGAYDAGSLQVWEFPLDTPLISLRRPYALRTVAWSPNGTSLAFAGHSRIIEIWDARMNRHLGQYIVSGSEIEGINRVKWSPNGRFLACATDEGNVHIWEVASGQLKMRYHEHRARVVDLSWSPQGTLMASCSVDKTGRVWDVLTGHTYVTYTQHTDEVHGISWSPDGKYIVSGSYDTTAQVWEALTGTPVMTFAGRSSGVVTVSWSDDGRMISLGSQHQGVEIWQSPV